MKFEVGTYYQTREGLKAVAYAIHAYAIIGALFEDDKWRSFQWCADGSINSSSRHRLDLIAEWSDGRWVNVNLETSTLSIIGKRARFRDGDDREWREGVLNSVRADSYHFERADDAYYRICQIWEPTE